MDKEQPLAGQANAPVLRARGLTKRFGDILAVRDVSLELLHGEVFGFLGLNGAGKSTTIRMFVGLLEPTAGSVELFGSPLSGNAARLLARVGAIVDGPAFFPYLSGRDNLRYFARLGAVKEARVDAVLERVALETVAGQRYDTFSMGMRQRLGLALALLRDPELLLLDEPTNGLDPVGQRTMRLLIKELAQEGRTVFLCSHLLHDVEQTCDRVAILQHGALVMAGPVSRILKRGEAIELRVRRPEAALALLAKLPWVTGVDREGDRLTLATPLARAEEVVAALAAGGLYPYEIHPREGSLEQFFLAATDDEARATATSPPADLTSLRR